MMDITEAVTQDFCDSFASDQTMYEGVFARLVAWLPLPIGVDESDPRVIEIVQACRTKHPNEVAGSK